MSTTLDQDDKLQCCVSFITKLLETRKSPLFVGLNGVQGSGKTTLVTTIAQKLRQPPFSLPTIVFSIDDLYLTHERQIELANAHPTNPLIQHRGQPSTHDLPLALTLVSNLRDGKETHIPSYDKSAYNGQGDRSPKDAWQVVNEEGQAATRVVIIEGWCVGFRALPDSELERRWEAAVKEQQAGGYDGRLGLNTLDNIAFVNDALRGYDQLTDQMDALIHLDASDPSFVYRWRAQQERSLRKAKGSGMTDEQVKEFIDGYYPAYELYTAGLREGVFNSPEGRQLRLVIADDRSVIDRVTI